MKINLRKVTSLAKQLSEINIESNWPQLISAAILSGVIGLISFVSGLKNLEYDLFTAQSATWLGLGKAGDYSFLWSIVLSLAPIFYALVYFTRKIEEKFGDLSASEFTKTLKISLIPVFLGIAVSVVTKEVNFFLPALTIFLMCSSFFLALLFLGLQRLFPFQTSSSLNFEKTFFNLTLSIIASALSVFGFMTAIQRFSPSHFESIFTQRTQIISVLIFGTVAAAVITSKVFFSFKQRVDIPNLHKWIVLFSLGHPLLAICIKPNFININGMHEIPFNIRSNFYFLLLVLVLVSYAAIFLRFLSPKSTGNTWLKILGSYSLLGPLVYFKFQNLGIPNLSTDDYHFGEFAVPGSLLSDSSLRVYGNLDPARGAINFLPGWISQNFFDGTFASYPYTFLIIYALVLLIALPVISMFLPYWMVAGALMVFPAANGLSEIDLLAACFLLLAGILLMSQRRQSFIWIFSFGAPLFIVFAPGQGAIALLSLGPAYIYSIISSRTSPRRVVFESLPILLAAIFIFVSGKFPTLGGALTYGFEQSAANTQAYGVPWAASLVNAPINPILFELIRSSWIFVPSLLLVLAPRIISNRETRHRIIFIALPIFITSTLLIGRAAGRIDPGVPSRLGSASILAIALFAPVLAVYVFRVRPGLLLLTTIGVPAALIAAMFGSNILTGSSIQAVTRPLLMERVTSEQANSMSISQKEFPNIGRALIEPHQFQRLLRLKEVVTVLAPSKSEFLDLTNHGADYAYLNRTPPVASSAVYNLVTEGQQKRSIEALEKSALPIILVSSENILHDGGTLPIRSPFLYKYLSNKLNLFSVMKSGDDVWLVPKSKETLAIKIGLRALDQITASNELDRVWSQNDLSALPISWGRSWTSLSQQTLDAGIPIERKNLTSDIASSPMHTLALANTEKLSFPTLGILVFDFKCLDESPIRRPAKVSVFSNSTLVGQIKFQVEPGKIAVPVYAIPSLSTRHYSNISISLDVSTEGSCLKQQISELQLRKIN